MEHSMGVRKGAWSQQEDVLLRKCVEKYGEGKWRQVPLRAGLNRCRKSCRLRWLNYLRPNIKRGEFTSDEVDLIVRMHKLLGNRWSLIAGRLPGRTANDIKNYCNTHMKKMLLNRNKKDLIMKLSNDDDDDDINQINNVIKPKAIKVLKPLPRTFSSSRNNMSLMQHFKVGQPDLMPLQSQEHGKKIIIRCPNSTDDIDDDEREEETSDFSLSSFGEKLIKSFCGGDDQGMELMMTTNNNEDVGLMEEGIMNNKEHNWDDVDLHIDENLWSLLGLDEQEIIM